jgi:hypothetical protein
VHGKYDGPVRTYVLGFKLAVCDDFFITEKIEGLQNIIFVIELLSLIRISCRIECRLDKLIVLL